MRKMSKLLKKTLLAAIILFAILAVAHSIFSVWSLNKTLVSEYRNEGIAITKTIANSSIELLFDTPYETIQSTIDAYLEIDEIAYVFVRNAEGEIIAHHFVPTIPDIFATPPQKKKELSEIYIIEKPIIKEFKIAGIGKVIDISSQILAGVGGEVHVGLKRKFIDDNIWWATVEELGIIGLFFIVTTILAYCLVDRISQDLNKLITGVQQVQKGNYDVHISVRDHNEIGLLAKAFNNMVATIHDYDQSLKQSLEELSRIKYAVDQSCIVSITDLNGNITYVNDKFCEISGYSQQELFGKTHSVIKAGCHKREFFQNLWSTITSGSIWRGEIKNKTKAGKYYWVETTIVPLIDDFSGQLLQYLAIQNDVTHQKLFQEKLENEVQERTVELALANDAICQLNKQLKAENIKIKAELHVARQMQQLILPNPEELKGIKELDIAGFMEPAEEVGGDYYDVLDTDGVVTIAIGDVTGHGLESGILMVMTQAIVRCLQELGEIDPITSLTTLNQTIYKNVQRMNSDKNLTLAILHYAQGIISLSGQHEETIVVRESGEIECIDTMDLGFPIGLDDDISNFIDHKIIKLNTGDGIVLYTDGITEARDINKKLYGQQKLCNVLHENWHLSSQEIQEAVITDIRHHIGKQRVFDDITLLVIKQL